MGGVIGWHSLQERLLRYGSLLLFSVVLINLMWFAVKFCIHLVVMNFVLKLLFELI